MKHDQVILKQISIVVPIFLSLLIEAGHRTFVSKCVKKLEPSW